MTPEFVTDRRILESCILGCQNSDLTVSESHERVLIGFL